MSATILDFPTTVTYVDGRPPQIGVPHATVWFPHPDREDWRIAVVLEPDAYPTWQRIATLIGASSTHEPVEMTWAGGRVRLTSVPGSPHLAYDIEHNSAKLAHPVHASGFVNRVSLAGAIWDAITGNIGHANRWKAAAGT